MSSHRSNDKDDYLEVVYPDLDHDEDPLWSVASPVHHAFLARRKRSVVRHRAVFPAVPSLFGDDTNDRNDE